VIVGVAFVAACGRLGFDAIGDGASGDAGPGCLASYELCDGFESPGFASYWVVGANATRDTTVAHRGAASLHVRSAQLAASQGGTYVLEETTTLALGDPTFYVRAYVRFGSLPLAPNHGEIIAAETSTSSDEDAVFLGPDLSVYSQWPDSTMGNNMVPPTDTWLCLLFTVVRKTTATGTLTLSGDVPGALLGNVQTDGPPGLFALVFGLEFAAPNQTVDQPPIDVWIDDIIVDKSPLTCAD
jgi:hypothetical protein